MFWRANGFARNALALVAALALPMFAHAGLIRDAEIETTLETYARPIFASAQIEPDSVRILIVDSKEVNAYVAGGLNMFINTALIREAKTPDMLIGVIAHETGHIAGAHLSQLREKASRATLGSLIGSAVGAAITIGGGGKAGAGAAAAAQNVAQRTFLSEIRLNEQSADHAALKYLDENDISAKGMLDMFEVLRARESGGLVRDKYLQSHPLSSERIATMRNHLQASDIPEGKVPAAYKEKHARMLAKLVAFTESYETTLQRYPESDNSIAARYARAIAEFRRSRYDAALEGINALIKQSPNDPFFYDTRGQIEFENGKLNQAAASYAKASSLKPGSALIKTDYARTLIAQDNPALLPQAIRLLEQSKALDDSYGMTFRQLAIAYGKQGKLGHSYAALAEEAALSSQLDQALQHISRARGYAQSDDGLLLQLDDLDRDVKAQRQKKKEAESPF